jgi:hypothetical protein
MSAAGDDQVGPRNVRMFTRGVVTLTLCVALQGSGMCLNTQR